MIELATGELLEGAAASNNIYCMVIKYQSFGSLCHSNRYSSNVSYVVHRANFELILNSSWKVKSTGVEIGVLEVL